MIGSGASRYVFNHEVETPEFESRRVPPRPIGSVLGDLAAGGWEGADDRQSGGTRKTGQLSEVGGQKGGAPTVSTHDRGDMFIEFDGLPDEVIRTQKAVMAATIPFFANMGSILENSTDEDETDGGGGRCVVKFDPKIVPPAYFRHILTFTLSERLSMGNVSVSVKTKLVKACEFLLFDSLPAQVKLTSNWSWTAKRTPEWVRVWERNVADQRDRGVFCDLTVTLGVQKFTLHKKVVVSVLSNLSTLFPNIDEVSDINLDPEEIEPNAFQTLIDHAYGAQEEGLELKSWHEFFYLAQASIHLGCDYVSFWCCETLKSNSLSYLTEKADCLKLWRYANHLQTSSGWNFPVQFCNGLITLIFSERRCTPSFYEEDREILRKFTFDQVETLLLSFKPHDRLQAGLLCILGIWVEQDLTKRLECAEKLLTHINLPVALCRDADWELRSCSGFWGSKMMQARRKGLVSYKSKIVEALLSTGGAELKPTDKHLQARFLSYLTARGTCFMRDRYEDQKVVRAFSPSGNLMFHNSAAFAFKGGFVRLKIVSFDAAGASAGESRLFLICRRRELKLKSKNSQGNLDAEAGPEDMPWAWELRRGEVAGKYCLQWLTSRLPHGNFVHVFSDRNRFLYVAEFRTKLPREVRGYSLHCCVYNLGGAALGRFDAYMPIGDGSGEEKVPFFHSFETGKFPIPTYESRDPPDLKACATDGVFFLFRSTHTKMIGDRQIVKYDVQSYNVEQKEWVDRPSLPSYVSEESLQLVACSGIVYAGFAVNHLTGLGTMGSHRAILSVLENGPTFEIWVLRPGAEIWELMTSSPSMVYATPDFCQFFSVGSRLFVTGYEHWGGVKVTKSFDLKKQWEDEDGSGSEMESSWVTHPELVGYAHPELFSDFDAGPGPDPELGGECSTNASTSSATDPNPPGPVMTNKFIRATHHPPYPEMVLEAVKTLGDPRGSSLHDIYWAIRDSEYDLGTNDQRIRTYTQRGLKTQLEKGRLEAVRNDWEVCYKIKTKPLPKKGKKVKAGKGKGGK